MKRVTSYIATCFLIILLCIAACLFIKHQRLVNENRTMSEYLRKSLQLFTAFSETIGTFTRTSGTSIPDIELIDSQGNQKMLSEVVENEKMFVYLPQIACNTCTYRETEMIHAIFGEKVNDVMIVSNFQSLREQIVFERETLITTYSLKRDATFPLPEFEQQTVLFLVSNTLHVYCVLIPDETTSKISEIYYQAVAQRIHLLNE